MTKSPVIIVEKLTKYFPRKPQQMRKREELGSFMSRRFSRKKKPEPFLALSNVSFSVNIGESVGVVGSNGAGKSTLLRVLTGISMPSGGNVTIRGEYRELFALNAGFNMELSGRKNLYLYAAMKGLSRNYIEKKIENIIEFAGIGDFIDEPVKNYSSGMRGRLGFSLVSHTAPDILFIDEALSTGDAAFKQKCDDVLLRYREEEKTLMIVSHGAGVLEKLCTRAIWLDHGKIKMDGPANEVLESYAAYQQERVRTQRKNL